MVVNVANKNDVPLRADYSAYGVETVLSGNADFIPFGFAGGIYDPDTGLVRFGARDYDPAIGQWVSKDPIGFNGDQTNLYVYVGNDPVNNTDPTGHYIWVINWIVCSYYESKAADAVQECTQEYLSACADYLSDSCSNFCGGDPSYPTDDVNKCVQRKNPDAWQGVLKWCSTAAIGSWSNGKGATGSSKP